MSDEHLEDNLYIADVHSSSQPDQLLIIAGSNFGDGLVGFVNYYDVQPSLSKSRPSGYSDRLRILGSGI